MHEGGVLCTRALSQKRVADRSLKAAPPSCTVRVAAGANMAAGAPWTPLPLAISPALAKARQSAVAAPSRDCCRCQRRRACGEGSLPKRPVLDPKLDSLSARARKHASRERIRRCPVRAFAHLGESLPKMGAVKTDTHVRHDGSALLQGGSGSDVRGPLTGADCVRRWYSLHAERPSSNARTSNDDSHSDTPVACEATEI
ncbi:hypothetical protein GY45DRAFT_869580 [Cubamyces sp. BRFM 1775]|nr:hypothetical protein GY45DRAFT_869580 [Cubamyces sp. BRFM 1775]